MTEIKVSGLLGRIQKVASRLFRMWVSGLALVVVGLFAQAPEASAKADDTALTEFRGESSKVCKNVVFAMKVVAVALFCGGVLAFMRGKGTECLMFGTIGAILVFAASLVLKGIGGSDVSDSAANITGS